jgi:MoaA/NifB/PqqE/SkfB family radical SAM enzyme
MHSASHPILAQIVPVRRCNLDCAYCDEYDKTSGPVPLETMLRRIDHLAELGTTIITLSGGEPTLHPDLDALIRHIRNCGAIATLITNGLLLTPDRTIHQGVIWAILGNAQRQVGQIWHSRQRLICKLHIL